jgi:hypothetical protein
MSFPFLCGPPPWIEIGYVYAVTCPHEVTPCAHRRRNHAPYNRQYEEMVTCSEPRPACLHAVPLPLPPPPPVARRYRLFVRFSPCRSYYQYGVTEEGTYGAILVRIEDDNEFGRRNRGQELVTGDIIRIPGEPGPFRVQLYADDNRFW